MHWFEHVAKETFDEVFTVSATSNLPAERLYVRSNPLQASFFETLTSSTEQPFHFVRIRYKDLRLNCLAFTHYRYRTVNSLRIRETI